jgi:hypothetical protein
MKKKVLFLTLFVQNFVLLCAQRVDFGLDYTTEIQTNFRGQQNWVNLLSLSAELPSENINSRWRNGVFNIETITIYNAREERILDDLMTFSNIDEPSMPLGVFLLGYTHHWGRFSLFGGLRNVNHDYFAKHYTSFFTNSSAGIFPTVDANFPVANYPFSAVCIHIEYQINDRFLLKSSLYNGVAHNPQRNPLQSFIVNPRRDGVFSISELSYTQNRLGNGIYSVGMAVHAFGEYSNSAPSLWLTVEQSILQNNKREIGFLFHSGFALSPESECRRYFATGLYAAGLFTREKRDRMGIYFNKARFSGITEQTMEITWQYRIMDFVAVQPTFRRIHTGNEAASVGLLRILFSI